MHKINWEKLKKNCKPISNKTLVAVMPLHGSTSVLSNTSSGVYPVPGNFYKEREINDLKEKLEKDLKKNDTKENKLKI